VSQFRSNWTVNNVTGVYTAHIPSPTGIPSDPALSGYGVLQSKELAEKLITLDPPIDRYYSSPFYRCIQTLYPTLDKLCLLHPAEPEPKIWAENGVGEWYGKARWDHPSPAEPELLKELFPRFNLDYEPKIIPSSNGETLAELHNRVAYALLKVIQDCDSAGIKAIIICTHAASLYAIGRALTGQMPEDVTEEDFRPFTCGLTKFVRRPIKAREKIQSVQDWRGEGSPIPEVQWDDGNGIAGGWDCTVNGDCSHLSGGEERGW